MAAYIKVLQEELAHAYKRLAESDDESKPVILQQINEIKHDISAERRVKACTEHA